jgi:hypothetical protein
MHNINNSNFTAIVNRRPPSAPIYSMRALPTSPPPLQCRRLRRRIRRLMQQLM